MDWTKQLGRYVIVMLLQVLLFDQLQLWGVCHPYIYILCLLMLPITLPRWADMLIGFAFGLLMDVLGNSVGVHTAACTLLMFIRQPLVNALVQDAERLTGEISWTSISPDAFIKYVAILVGIHQTAVSLLSAWGFHHFGMTLLQIIISSALCFGLIMGYNVIRDRQK